MNHYDVIVIGSGAGGGTLVHRLAPSGKQVLLLERGDWLPREPQQLVGAPTCSSTTATSRPTPGTTRTTSRSSRRSTTSSAAPPSSTAPRSTGCARRTSASSRTTTASRPPGRSATTSSSPTTRRPSSSTRCTARAARTRPSRTRARPTRTRRSATSRGSSSSPTTSRRPGCTRSTRPCGVLLDEADRPYSRCVRCATCDGFPCLVHAKSDAEVLAVRPALAHRNVTLLTGARALRLETDAAGTAVTGVVVERDGEQETFTADIVVVACGAANSAALLLNSSSAAHPRGLANASDQVGRNYMFHNSQAVLALSQGAEPDRLPEDARAQRLLLRHGRLRVPAGEHPDGREVLGRHVPRREAAADQARAAAGRWTKVASHAVDFWLSTEDLPRPENRVTLRARREHPARVRADQPGAQAAAARRARSRCSAHRGCTSTT